MKGAVDRWEILNEPDMDTYWHGTDSQYVNNVLKAAWNSLHPNGETVVGAGAAGSVDAARRMRDAGYLNYCDIANFHPYGWSVQSAKDMISQVDQIFGGKPLTATEWNLHVNASGSSWASMLAQLHPYIAQHFDGGAYYYKFQYGTSSMSGPAGVVTSSYQKHNPFYDVVKDWNN